MIIIKIDGKPTPLKRHRHRSAGHKIITYDSQKSEKENFRLQLKYQFMNEPITAALSIKIKFFMPIPKWTSSPRRYDMIENTLHHMVRPDIDNLAKFVLDCMNGIVFNDDAQIYEMKLEKLYGTEPCTIIYVSTTTQE